nr:ATPase PAAT isoform X2 [Anas platyrhynchos]|eukprot:XP_027315997.1 uncharacterized protein C10orf88 homolog isoform X2 [Anas platyrhynchos]
MASGCGAAAPHPGGPGEPPGVAVGCSWPCSPPGELARVLCVRRGEAAGPCGASPGGSEAVVVVAAGGGGGEAGCVLQLQCRPPGAEEVAAVGVVSEARNMEVYAGEEYCGTGRGESLGAAGPGGETEKVTLYKKYLKLECPAASCRIKLLSIGSSIDLDRVQTIMESMGSKLSPGAQQLMDMVRYQQKNSSPLGDKLSWIFGKNSDFGDENPVDGLHGATVQMSQDQSDSESLSVKNPLTSETVCEDSKINLDQNTQVPERENVSDSGGLTTQQNTVDFRNDLKVMGSLLMQEQTNQNVASPQVLLPFLQNICSQVNHLRLKDGDRHLSKNTVTKEEGIQAVRVEQQPICSYLEKIISKNMDLMEKKLMDYIDRQIQALQTHIDNKMVLLMDLVQNSKQNKISQAHYDSSEGFSNGER